MPLIVLKTDIHSRKRVKALQPLFDQHPYIEEWSIDTEDIDNVLRLKTPAVFSETDAIQLLKLSGFQAEMLPD